MEGAGFKGCVGWRSARGRGQHERFLKTNLLTTIQVPFILGGGIFALGLALSGWLFYWGVLPLARRLEREVPLFQTLPHQPTPPGTQPLQRTHTE